MWHRQQHGLLILPAGFKTKSPWDSWKGAEGWSVEQWDQVLSTFPDDPGARVNYWMHAGASKKAVLDIDSDEADRFWREVVGIGDLMDRTVCARTRKGHHYYFEGDIKGWAFHEGDLHFDVKARGGGVLAPSSTHPEGDVYEWVREPGEFEFVELPPELFSRAAIAPWLPKRAGSGDTGNPGQMSLEDLREHAPVGPDSGRNVWLAKVCGHHARTARLNGWDWNTYLAVCRVDAESLTDPLPYNEFQKIAASIWQTDKDNHKAGEGGGESYATLLVELARSRYRFGLSHEGGVFAVRSGSHIGLPLQDGKLSLRVELSHAFYESTGKAVNGQALTDALNVIEGEARQQDPEPLALRVATADGASWIDLGDADERVVRIDPEGWDLVDEAPVLFERSVVTDVFPEPTRGTEINALWEHLNVTEADRPLVLAWAVQTLLQPEQPHPIMLVQGEHGTAKTTLCGRLASLVDPNPAPMLKPPKDETRWVDATVGQLVVGLDNLSSIPDWLSDAMCRAATGSADKRRAHYANKGMVVFQILRSIIINGIDVGALNGDLADRAVAIHLDRIDAYKSERVIKASWADAYPGLVGAVFTLASEVLRVLPEVEVEKPPRMVDFFEVLTAVDRVLGTEGVERYLGRTKILAADTLDRPFAAAIVARGKRLRGTPGEIFDKIPPPMGRRIGDLPGWPKTPRYVTTQLRRFAPAFRELGWEVTEGTDTTRNQTVWDLKPPKSEEEEGW